VREQFFPAFVEHFWPSDFSARLRTIVKSLSISNDVKAKDIFIGLTHFTSALLLLILATICAGVFGFIFPLLALHGSHWFADRPGWVVGGMIGSLILLFAYFTDELVHYRIITGSFSARRK
jgi:hypothetical protein